MVMFTGFWIIILFVTIIAGPLISYISGRIFQVNEFAILLWDVLRYVIGFTVIIGLVGTIYHSLPNLSQTWCQVVLGALFAGMVWLLVVTLFTWLISAMTDYSKTYGSLGGVVTMLLFFQLSAAILIVGAEDNARRLQRKPAMQKP